VGLAQNYAAQNQFILIIINIKNGELWIPTSSLAGGFHMLNHPKHINNLNQPSQIWLNVVEQQ